MEAAEKPHAASKGSTALASLGTTAARGMQPAGKHGEGRRGAWAGHATRRRRSAPRPRRQSRQCVIRGAEITVAARAVAAVRIDRRAVASGCICAHARRDVLLHGHAKRAVVPDVALVHVRRRRVDADRLRLPASNGRAPKVEAAQHFKPRAPAHVTDAALLLLNCQAATTALGGERAREMRPGTKLPHQGARIMHPAARAPTSSTARQLCGMLLVTPAAPRCAPYSPLAQTTGRG